uniref:Uncharacterized protein n=1 Tax=Canis lupus dingo TaxID=286419 RepID=A0A8C0K3M2_CANLU
MRNSAYIFDDVKLQRRVPQHFCELCRKSTLRSALGQQGEGGRCAAGGGARPGRGCRVAPGASALPPGSC